MWVMAIQMRRGGMKLPQHELEAMTATRGRLWVTVARGWAQDRERRPLTASLLGPRDGADRLVFRQLDRVRVKVRDGQVMVLGYEDHSFSPRRQKLVPQVWWCDPLAPAADAVEARAKARFPPTLGQAKRLARAGLDMALELPEDDAP